MKLDRDRWQSERIRLVSAFHSRQDPRTLLKRLAAHADESLIALWRRANLPASACLIAVGGYGRGELFPGSDLDLLILIDETLEDDAKPKLEAFIGACWDLGLDVGHAVRSIQQCLEESAADITVQTSLLEARLLIGPRDRMLELAKRLSQQQDAGAFFEAKQLEMRQRHLRFDDSPYSLEPHVKESPGGLRDLQLLIWLARAAGMPTTWLELSQVGVISREEYRTLQQAQRLLTMIRISLHRLSGRREDRLVFDLQVRVAQDLGIGAQGARRASEALMQRYYMAAKRVSQMRSILMQLIESYLFDRQAKHSVELDEEFVVRDDMLALKDPSLIDRDLSVVFRAFLRTMEHPGIRGMAPDLLRAIWLSRPRMDASFRRLPANRCHFMQVLMQGRGVTKALYDMNQWSVLGRYLPEWRRIVGRMQHDLFHVYTVDQHILTVLRNVQRFSMPEHVHEFPLCSEIVAAMESPWRLSIAALYHDIAKGRGGDHSSLGAAEVRRFCRAHGIEREDSALIEWLVEHHLAMSSVAQKQDISDPEIVEQFAKFVVSEERLNALYLLTVADIRGTSPKVWNSWKGKLLEDLYRSTKRIIGGERLSAQSRLDSKRKEAVRLLHLVPLLDREYAAFWQRLDAAYFLRHDAADIAWHTRVLYRLYESEEPVVRARISPEGGGFQVLVYTSDQSQLFARITRYFDSRSISVQHANVHTLRGARALDSFIVSHPDHEGNYRELLTLVESELKAYLIRNEPLLEPKPGKTSRRSRSFPVQTRVALRPDSSATRYILSLSTSDRSGLLYAIAHTLANRQVQLESARVTTLGERVEDTFVVKGDLFAEERARLALESDLLKLLQPS